MPTLIHRYPAAITSALILLASAAQAQKPLVIVDPGHGGDQAGVEHEGLMEKDLVLPIGFVLAEALGRAGYPVVFTRTTDTTMGFGDRLQLAERRGAPVLVSLHINGNEDSTRHGIEILTAPAGTPNAAWTDRIAEALRETGAPVTIRNQESRLFQSATTAMVMIELGYMTHPVERRLVMSRAYQHELARLIVAGIDAHLAAGR